MLPGFFMARLEVNGELSMVNCILCSWFPYTKPLLSSTGKAPTTKWSSCLAAGAMGGRIRQEHPQPRGGGRFARQKGTFYPLQGRGAFPHPCHRLHRRLCALKLFRLLPSQAGVIVQRLHVPKAVLYKEDLSIAEKKYFY
jgi:hypothetical protein